MLINRRPILGKNRSRFNDIRRPSRFSTNYTQLRKEVLATSEMLVILRSSDFVRNFESQEASSAL